MAKKQNGGSTIRQIAKEAGVSISTVSRVINRPEMVSRKMRERVLPVVEKYNYVPNLLAKNIFSGRSNSIAFFAFDLLNTFIITVIKQLNEIALKHQYNLITFSTDSDPERERDYLRYCHAIRCSGIILSEGMYYLNKLDDSEIDNTREPVLVSLDRYVSESIPHIVSDNVAGVADAVDYLVSLGHRRIGFAGHNPSMYSVHQRLQGYKKGLERHGLGVREDYVLPTHLLRPVDGARAFEVYAALEEPPSAMICSNDHIAQGFIARAHACGLRVPEDVSVIGFDGTQLYDNWPQLTTVRQDTEAISRALFDCVMNPADWSNDRRFATSLFVGQTCAAYRD